MENKSFTLIELLIVIGIFTILASISFLGLRSIRPILQLSGMTRELVTDLRYAQQLAVTEQTDHGVRFSFAENKYQIIRYAETEEILKQRILPEGINLQKINNFDEARFNPYGAVIESGKVNLVNIKTKTIEIKPSGFVKIE